MILLKIKEVPGDSKMKGYEDWITVSSISWNCTREPKESAKAGTSDIFLGTPELAPVSVTKSMDRASINLLKMALSGKASEEVAKFAFLQTMGEKYEQFLEIRLSRCLVKSWSISGSEDERPEETIEFMYNKIWMEYSQLVEGKTPTKAGNAGWDQVVGQAWGGS
ncbi:MAG: Hcp family type VI secretion system effector [Gammaproteobacteria bacterium]